MHNKWVDTFTLEEEHVEEEEEVKEVGTYSTHSAFIFNTVVVPARRMKDSLIQFMMAINEYDSIEKWNEKYPEDLQGFLRKWNSINFLDFEKE